MPLPRIPNTTPYTDSFIVSLGLGTTFSPSLKQYIQIQLRPYNYSTGELMQGPDAMPGHSLIMDTTLKIDDVYAEAARVPLLGQIMGGIVTLVSLLIQEKDLNSQLAATTDPDAQAAIQAQLTAVQQQMGMTV